MNISTSYDKVLNASHRLNAEAYEHQVIQRGKSLKHFIPCAKAEMLMEVIRHDKHFGQAHINASVISCNCHPGLSESQLMAYEYDPSYKEANYAHDYKKLYPRLYKS